MAKTGYNTGESDANISYGGASAKLLPEEREVVLVMDDKDRVWKASCSSPTYMRKFEKQGWKRGTGRPCSEAAKLGSSRSRKGKIAVWKEGHPTYINSEELDHYLTLGYSKQKKESYDRV